MMIPKPCSTRSGVVLILSVGIIVLMAGLAVGFLIAVSPQRGAGETQAMERMALMASNTARDRAITAILDDHARRGYTSLRGRWRKDFKALATDGQPMSMWEGESWNNPPRLPDTDPAINVPYTDPLYDQFKTWAPDGVPGYSGKAEFHLLGTEDDSLAYSSQNPTVRWNLVQHLDRKFLPTTVTEAVWTVRFAVEVVDLEGYLRVNPDYPDVPRDAALPGADATIPAYPVYPDALDPTNVDFLRYRSYLSRYARSLSGMYGTREARTINLHVYDYGMDPNDLEPTELIARSEPARNMDSHKGGSTWFRQGGYRHTAADLFRGERLRWSTWANSYCNAMAELTHEGRVFSFATVIDDIDDSKNLPFGYGTRMNGYGLSPFGQGMRDQHWAPANPAHPINGDNATDPNVPWRVNLLTATTRTTELMLWGMSSRLRWSEGVRSGRSGATDLLGKDYPEAFPLGIDHGRDVSIIGADKLNGKDRIDWGFHFGEANDPGGQIDVTSQNDYWSDCIVALAKVIQLSRFTWNNGWNLRVQTVANGKHYDPDCLLDPTVTNPAAITTAIEAEWMRILGENATAPGSGLLASRNTRVPVEVGYASFGRIQARVEPEGNTRGMEFLLNDLRMSFLGLPARNFNGDDDNRDGTVDADDGESTEAGWWFRGERTWSWWHVGLDRVPDAADDWMRRSTWYRFWYGDSRQSPAYSPGPKNRIARWDGETWAEWVASDGEFGRFLAVNSPFLRAPGGSPWSSANRPVKPWSATGRLFIGQSRLWMIVARGQVFDQILRTKAGEVDAEVIFNVVPDRTGDLSASRVLFTRYHGNMHTDE